MKKIKLIKAQKPIKVECGDYLFGTDYLEVITQDDFKNNQILLLINFASYSPNALELLDCFDAESLGAFFKDSIYICPFNKEEDREFLGVYPLAILSNDVNKYRSDSFKNDHWDYAFDHEWTKSMGGCKEYIKYEEIRWIIPIDSIAKTYLGHGYTCGTLPSDGYGSVMLVKVPLDNGDWLACATWEWYNK